MYRIKGLIYRNGEKFSVESVLGPLFALNLNDAYNTMKEYNIEYYCIYLESVI